MYLALARKYRPQKFEDLIGQPHITKTLQNAITLDKLYPSLIFSGTKGVGKTSAARILSKALNCEKGPAAEPCNQCVFCTEITEDKSPDYIEIDGASNNGVEEVRNLKEKVKYKPFKNRFRIVVIDEVHMLSNSAWNALLKTIEEPPEHTYFVMATTDFHKIPATIVSRCQQFEFKRIPRDVIVTLLKEICEKEEIKITEYSLYLVAKASEGSLRDAKKILDQAIAISSGDIQDKNVIDILGVIEEEIFISLTRDIFTQNRKGIIELINDLAERGMDLRFFYNEYLKFFRDLMVLKSLDDAERLHNLNPENVPVLREMMKDVREIELLRYFNAAKDLELAIRNTENPRIILEYLFLKLSYFPSLVSIEELIQNAESGGIAAVSSQPAGPPPRRGMDAPQVPASSMPQPASGPAPQQSNDGIFPIDAPNAAPSPDMRADIKNKLIDAIKDKPRLKSNLSFTTVTLNNNILTVQFPGDREMGYKGTLDNVQYLQEVAGRVLKQQVEIRVILDESTGHSAEQARMKDIEQDPKVNNLMERLQGKILNIKKV
jgi:DNA polymerase III subunit gamma/tau